MCCNMLGRGQGRFFPHRREIPIKGCGKLLEKCGKMEYTILSICKIIKFKE